MRNASIVSISKLLKWRRRPRRRLARQVLTKAKHKNLVISIKEVNIDLLLEEVTSQLQQTFEDSTALKEFVNALFKEKEPLREIVEHHRYNYTPTAKVQKLQSLT